MPGHLRPMLAAAAADRWNASPATQRSGTPHKWNETSRYMGLLERNSTILRTRGIVLGTRRPRRKEHERLHACVKRGCRRHYRAGPRNWLPAWARAGLGGCAAVGSAGRPAVTAASSA